MRVEIANKKKINMILSAKYNINNINAIKGITIDSRLVKNGDIFLPLIGQNTDGHNYIDSAINLGASLIFSEKELDNNSKIIHYVNSTYDCLKNISKEWRNNFSGNVIGITGSNGKTTTKELLAHILSSKIKCNYTKGNFNSTTGVPLSIISMNSTSDAYIIELGMSKPGEIQTLCDITMPNIGLITNISGAHIEYFKSIKNIAKEKSSLFLSLSNNDTAFYNIDDNYIKNIPTEAKKITYSLYKNADYTGKIIVNKAGKRNLLINNKDKIRLSVNTNSFTYNALAAYAIADYIGINTNNIIDRIESFENLSGRGKIYSNKGIIIIDDTYNSNLESAKEGILNLSNYSQNHRCIAVIGDMLELGSKGILYHQKLGEFILKYNIDTIFGIGKLTKNTIKILKSNNINAFFFYNRKKLSNQLEKFLKKGDVIYFKASRGMFLETIIKEVFK